MMKQDLALKSYKRIVNRKMNVDCRVKRLERCQELLRRFLSERSVQKVWFTDEKNILSSYARELTEGQNLFLSRQEELEFYSQNDKFGFWATLWGR